MTSSNRILGCTSSHYGVRIIAILDFWIGVLLLIKCLAALNPYYVHVLSSVDYASYVLNVFVYLFLIFVFLYINYYLKESTYDFKVHKIYQWLTINTMFLTFHVLAITYIVIMSYNFQIIYYSMPINFLHSCQIYVVKSFYDEQIVRAFAAATAATSSARAAVAFDNNAAPPATSTGPSAPSQRQMTEDRQFSPAHGVDTAGTVAGPQHQHAVDPVITIYPQLEDHLRNAAVAESDQRHPAVQELYCKPPAYYPSYGARTNGNPMS